MKFRHLLAVAMVAACGGDDGGLADGVLDGFPSANLTADPELAKQWAEGSAPNMMAAGYEYYALVELAVEEETNCPTKTMTGTEQDGTVTYEGGCMQMDGSVWSGKIVAVAKPVGDGKTEIVVDYDKFRVEDTEDCNGQTLAQTFEIEGSFRYSGSETTGITFTTDVVIRADEPDDNCNIVDAVIAVAYSGSAAIEGPDADGDGDLDTAIWNGSGRFGDSERGVADVATRDEVVNDVTCADEASSGETTISAGGHEIAVQYDGATDCETSSTVQWSFDGAAQGELSGVECNAGGGSGYAMLLVVFGLAMRRRRRD